MFCQIPVLASLTNVTITIDDEWEFTTGLTHVEEFASILTLQILTLRCCAYGLTMDHWRTYDRLFIDLPSSCATRLEFPYSRRAIYNDVYNNRGSYFPFLSTTSRLSIKCYPLMFVLNPIDYI